MASYTSSSRRLRRDALRDAALARMTGSKGAAVRMGLPEANGRTLVPLGERVNRSGNENDGLRFRSFLDEATGRELHVYSDGRVEAVKARPDEVVGQDALASLRQLSQAGQQETTRQETQAQADQAQQAAARREAALQALAARTAQAASVGPQVDRIQLMHKHDGPHQPTPEEIRDGQRRSLALQDRSDNSTFGPGGPVPPRPHRLGTSRLRRRNRRS